MQATTARNIAIGCAGLAAVLLVLTLSGAFKSKYPHWCKPLKFESWGQYVPVGNWCIEVGANWTLVVTAQSKFDFEAVEAARVRILNPSRITMSDSEVSRLQCQGPWSPFTTAMITPPKETMVYVKVRMPHESDIATCWYNIPIPTPR